jgi:hypothetical protein
MVHQLARLGPVPLWLMAMIDQASLYKHGMTAQIIGFYCELSGMNKFFHGPSLLNGIDFDPS